MDPSHMPRINRNTKRLAKLVQAAMQANAIPQTKILTLVDEICLENVGGKAGDTYLIHLPTGKRWRARFCGNSNSK
jgi:hypothetical protein